MDIEDFKKAKWSNDTFVKIANESVYEELDYQGKEAFRVIEVDFRDDTLGIDFRGEYMGGVPCEDIEIVEK